MKNEEILSEIISLPPEGRRQVMDYISFIRQYYGYPKLKEKTRDSLFDEDFVGIWKDRDDLKDSTAWVRGLRESEWAS